MPKRLRAPYQITPAAAMRRSREGLYEAGYRQKKLRIPHSFVARIDDLKRQYGLKKRDAVAGRIMRKAMSSYNAESFALPPPPSADDPIVTINIMMLKEQGDYLDAVAMALRGATLGVAFEAVFLTVPNIEPDPIQLSLIEGGMP